ncbi:MAG: HAD family hydrolase [candidate division Zixibacteria bacterium]|nr:HAD family hydrolase [candidate division Zixibacteria bacterium]
MVFSQDHAIEKPDPRLFKIAVEKANCCPDELLHVGDSPDTDIAGAHAAHVRSVWLNRNNATNNTSHNPDFEILSLRDLLDILPVNESVSS